MSTTTDNQNHRTPTKEHTMQRTADRLTILVGEDKLPITLTDSAVEAVQEEANGNIIEALSAVWSIEANIDGGESFADLEINDLLTVRDGLRSALAMAEVLVECRPLDDLDPEQA